MTVLPLKLIYTSLNVAGGVAAGIVTLLPLTNLDELFTTFISMGFTAKLHSFGQ